MTTVNEMKKSANKKISAKGALEKYHEMRDLEIKKSAESAAFNVRIAAFRKTLDETGAEVATKQKTLNKVDYEKAFSQYDDMRQLEKDRASMQAEYSELIAEIKKSLDEVAHVKTDDRQGDLDVDGE